MQFQVNNIIKHTIRFQNNGFLKTFLDKLFITVFIALFLFNTLQFLLYFVPYAEFLIFRSIKKIWSTTGRWCWVWSSIKECFIYNTCPWRSWSNDGCNVDEKHCTECSKGCCTFNENILEFETTSFRSQETRAKVTHKNHYSIQSWNWKPFLNWEG